MLSFDSPSSLQSPDSTIGKNIPRPPVRNDNHKPSYRLFPTVEPTPPESPIQLRTKTLPKPFAEPIRKRSVSLDESARFALRHNVPVKTVKVGHGRKVSVAESKPMSKAREDTADSPTVPVGSNFYARKFESESHNRSSSAAGDYAPNRQPPPSRQVSPLEVKPKQEWPRKPAPSQTPSHPHAAGLGLSLFPTVDPHQQQSNPRGRTKPKPNLTIDVNKEDKPPTPPPKSPRHSRSSSSQSGVSSLHEHEQSPPRPTTLATPGSVMRAALVDSPVRTPPTLNATQKSYFPPVGDVRVRQVTQVGPTTKRQNSGDSRDSPPIQSSNQRTQKKVTGYPPIPNVDKPMPSLPTLSSRFSNHIRQVREAESSGEKTPKAAHAPTDSASSARSEAPSTTPSTSSDLPEKKSQGLHVSQLVQVKSPNESSSISSARTRTPTPDQGVQSDSTSTLTQTASANTKTLPVLPPEPGPRSATPDPGSKPFPSTQNGPIADPAQTLQDLTKQSEALHARYASLRSDRLKLSTAISSSLRESKPGPDYVNALLDQHLSLNAINSSMDICFAKLKSLDCRKEEAISALVAQSKGKGGSEARKPASMKSPFLGVSSAASGRSTPDIVEPKLLTPEMQQPAKFTPTPEKAPEKVDVPTPETASTAEPSPKPEDVEQKDTEDSIKRTTVIRALSPPQTAADSEPVSPISSIGIEQYTMPKRIRIKGAKAAKILGLVSASSNGGNSKITLPDASSLTGTSTSGSPKELAVELQIHSNKSPLSPAANKAGKGEKTKTTPPSTSPPCPQRAPPSPPESVPPTGPRRKDTEDSVPSITSSSPPDTNEVMTPRESGEGFGGFRVTQKDSVAQTIQVFVDDDILDYYENRR